MSGMDQPKMEPMFLPGVENGARPGPYRNLIESFRQKGAECPQIWHLFAFRPEATDHLARFTQDVMRGPGPVAPGMRELIAAFTSYANDCPF